MYVFSVSLKCAFLLIRLLRPYGRLLNILSPEYYALVLKHESLLNNSIVLHFNIRISFFPNKFEIPKLNYIQIYT
jgi:hypothetical protein